MGFRILHYCRQFWIGEKKKATPRSELLLFGSP